MEKFKITDLKPDKHIQFMNNKKFFKGTIVKLQDNLLGVLISSYQDNVKILNMKL